MAAPEDRAIAWRLGAGVVLFLLLVSPGEVRSIDGTAMLGVAQSIVHEGSLAVPAEIGVEGRNGLFYSKYGVLLSLLSVPPVALVQPVGMLTGRVDLLETVAAAALIPIFTGMLAAALFLLGRRLGAPRAAAALVAAGALLGTYLLPYGSDFFTEPIVALGLVVMVERALAGRELQAGAALAFAVLARPQTAVCAPLLFAFLLARGAGFNAIVRTLPPLAIAAVVTVAYNLARFGEPLEFGYRPPVDPGFTTPFVRGAGGLLFSPEKSIFLFAPVIVLVPFALAALWRRERATAALLAALFAVMFVLAATWHSWMGGWSWGPRLLIPGVAILLVALGPWIGAHAGRLRLASVLFALGFVLSLAAVIAPVNLQQLDKPAGTDGPQLVRQVTEIPQLTRRSFGSAGDPGARRDDHRRYLAGWQVAVVRQLGPLAWPAVAVGTLALLAALLWVALPLARELRRGPRPAEPAPSAAA